jgi:hypothetical protein
MTTSISGTTGASLVQDATITQAKLSSNVAGNGPAFSAYQSVTQSIPATTFTKINLQSEEFDTANAFDSTTNYRFQPLVAGYYQVTGSIGDGGVAGSFSFVLIYKNGSQFKSTYAHRANASSLTSLVDALIYLNGSTDYLELFTYQSNAVSLSASPVVTYFQGYLARSA